MNNPVNLYKRFKVTYLFTTCAVLLLALLFVPVIPKFEHGEDNYFTVRVNGTQVGACGSREEADALAARARRELSLQSGEMVYVPVEVETEGREILFGQVDTSRSLVERMIAVLRESARETLQHAYTVKINEYLVNLSDSTEVLGLLQAVLEQYDTQKDYRVDLVVDPNRELNVLTTSIVKRGEEAVPTGTAGRGSGIEAYYEEVFARIEPDLGKSDFSSLDYGLVDIGFADPVEIVEAYLPEGQLTPLETAISEVTADQAKEQIYEVKAGDTLSQIAEDNRLPMGDLIAINPILEDENSLIRVGDELIITVPEPELSVIHRERVYEEDSYEADTVYLDNDDWYTTKSEVRQQPSAGFRKAAALVTYRNDTEVSEEVVKEEILYEAVPKIVERGTKIPPTYIKPISGGRVSSNFGRRSAPMKGASTNHAGIDWATPVGTAVMASSGGVVTRAGWGSGYGYVVYIQHEDGKETRYGHLSKVLVRVGQKVSQGQKIALSGNTGRSTGPHLHFEIRVNGQAVNPFNYVPR